MTMKQKNRRRYGVGSIAIYFLLFAAYCLPVTAHCDAELVDRVVAFVDLNVITLSDLRETYEQKKKVQPDISREEVLNTMINRLLLLSDARKLKIEGKTDDEVINEYVELKVKALIRISEESIEDYYKKNEQSMGGVPIESVRDKIEELLLEKEANELLKKQIAELRARSYVRILPGALQQP